jgi:hypothetical protein
MKLSALVIIIIVLFSACKNSITEKDDLNYLHSSDTVYFSTDKTIDFLDFYSHNDSIFGVLKISNNDTLYVGLYDTIIKSFDFQARNVLPPFFSSTDSIGYMLKIQFAGKDSLFFFQTEGACAGENQRLTLFDLNENKVLYQNEYIYNPYVALPKFVISPEFIYDKHLNRLFSIDRYFNFHDNSLLISVDLSTGEGSSFGISYPKEEGYKNLDKVINPFASITCLIDKDHNKIVIAFGISPTIYEYDIYNKKLNTHNVVNKYYKKSKYVQFEYGKLNYNEIQRVIETSYYHLRFMYDKYNKTYYRFFKQEMPEKDEDGLYTDYYKYAQFGISVISEDFEFLGDVLFPPKFKNILKRPYTLTSTGLRLYEFREKDNSLIIHKINIVI